MSFWKSLLLSSLMGSVCAWAIQASPFLINSVQPDGSILQIRKIGNEHFNYTVTGDDSILVVRDSSGYWNYADEHGKKTGMRVHAKSKRGSKEKNFLKKRDSHGILKNFRENRAKLLREHREYEDAQEFSMPQMLNSPSAVPMKANAWGWGTTETVTHTDWPTSPWVSTAKRTGEVRGIVILVQFSDIKFGLDDANAEYYDYLNKEGYSNYYMKGSARDYFISNSMGQYVPSFDVFGPITLKGDRDSYGALVDPFNIAKGAANAVKEAMDQLIAQNVDFSPYDSDGDKVIDFVYMIYAGVSSADTDVQSAIWPHSYNVRKNLTNGYSMNRYACSAELDGQAYLYAKRFGKTSKMLNGIGTFCHEFCHVLGLQDHYDVNANSNTAKTTHYTPNQWDLMDNGSYNCPANEAYVTSCSPANLNAFERFSLGWLEPRRLEISDTTFVLNKIQENDGLVLTSKNDNDYFFVDFRMQEGFDSGLPNKGMLIWHIYYNQTAWRNNSLNVSDTMRLDLIEADGRANVNTMRDDAFPTSRVNSFNGFVSWSGDSLGLEVYDIKIVDDHVEFKTRGNRVAPVDNRSSSSKKVSSSSSAKVQSSSSNENLSSSVESSSSVALSSSDAYSSSSLSESSSSQEPNSSSGSLFVNPVASSSSDGLAGMISSIAKAAVRWTVADGALRVNAKIEGRKTVRLFDVNGTLLLTKSFDEDFCEIRMDALLQNSIVVGTLDVGGRLIKTMKVRLK